MDVGSLLPLFGGLLVAAVAVYLARSQRDSLSVKTAMDAVAVAKSSMDLLMVSNADLTARVVALEGEVRECRLRLARQQVAIREVGGTVPNELDEEDGADDY